MEYSNNFILGKKDFWFKKIVYENVLVQKNKAGLSKGEIDDP